MARAEPEMRVSIKYNGKDVDDGTMQVYQVATALYGFASAYGRLASKRAPNEQHQLRVVALKASSFELVLAAWFILGQNSGQIEALGVAQHWASGIIRSIFSVISVKRHVQSQPHTVKINGNNNQVVIQNFQGAELAMKPEDYRVFHDGTLDSDLDKIVSPLCKDRIDRVELVAGDGRHDIAVAEVLSSEREFFFPESSTAETAKQVQIDGHVVSLNKDHNRGIVRLDDGKSIRYTYSGADPAVFHSDFGYRGKLRMHCIAHFDASLTLIRLDIKSVERLQSELF